MILFSALGLVMTGIAADLILLFLALELSSIPGYILVGLSRRHPLTEEAAAKYFFLGALATCLTAFGFVFLYGAAGTMNLAVCLTQSNWLVLAGLLIAFAGIAFKITVVPFYFYAPDVYQGAPAAATAIIAVLPKVTGFIALLKILAFIGFTGPAWTVFWPVLWIIAALTVTAGNVLALLQTDVKRILAYSSIAHSGYMLIGLAAAAGLPGGLQNGLAAVLFYVLIYGLMSLGSFGALGHLGNESAQLKDLAGLAKARPGLTLLFAFFILSLTGLPPTAGFWAKVYVFAAALGRDNPWLISLVVLGLLNAAVAAAYYFRIIAWLYTHPTPDSPAPQHPETPSGLPGVVPFGLTLLALLILLLGLFPNKLIQITESAAKALTP
jgi:NADH-quinone oxidoreductase subunit N